MVIKREPDEEVGKYRDLEELFLHFLTVLVHGVSYNVEIDVTFNQFGFFFLVVSVGMDYSHESRHKVLDHGNCHLSHELAKVGLCKVCQEALHGRFLFLFEPELVVGVEEGLEEFRHKAEAGSLVEEVKLFVVLVGSRGRFD